MKSVLAILLAAATGGVVQAPISRVADDARVIDRVAEVSHGDVPDNLLRRLVNLDLDLLRGRRADGTYQFATYERLESARTSESFSIETSNEDRLTKVETKGAFVYRAVLDVPARRLVVAKNRPVFVDHVEVEYMPQDASIVKTQVVRVGAWLEPGTLRQIDIEDIGRQTTVRVFARSDKKNGYGNLAVSLLQAKVIDNPDSPYADAVSSAKAILRALDHADIGSVRAMAQRIDARLRTPASASVLDVSATRTPEHPTHAAETIGGGVAAGGVQTELQAIEDLLTGTEAERRQGLDRLHQLLRRMRGSSGSTP